MSFLWETQHMRSRYNCGGRFVELSPFCCLKRKGQLNSRLDRLRPGFVTLKHTWTTWHARLRNRMLDRMRDKKEPIQIGHWQHSIQIKLGCQEKHRLSKEVCSWPMLQHIKIINTHGWYDFAILVEDDWVLPPKIRKRMNRNKHIISALLRTLAWYWTSTSSKSNVRDALLSQWPYWYYNTCCPTRMYSLPVPGPVCSMCAGGTLTRKVFGLHMIESNMAEVLVRPFHFIHLTQIIRLIRRQCNLVPRSLRSSN